MKGSLSRFSKRFKIVAMAIAISFVSVLFVSIFAESFIPQINSSEGICLFDRSLECPETVSEHITQWQQTFDNASQNSIFVIIAALLAFLATVLAVAIPTSVKVNLHERYRSKILLRSRRDKSDKLFDYILQAFSNGILHPKLF